MLVSTVPLCPVLWHRATWEHENNALYRFQIKYFDFFCLVLCPSSPSQSKKKNPFNVPGCNCHIILQILRYLSLFNASVLFYLLILSVSAASFCLRCAPAPSSPPGERITTSAVVSYLRAGAETRDENRITFQLFIFYTKPVATCDGDNAERQTGSVFWCHCQ